ncbi:unnamed protein product [Paramecium sonneborni]|uniref:Uncharacterized protein n=1 Tax=Paramecium sonneborni TaxID=65129 RepID=A0A8S1L8R9_9CILI|nr:unnamed protein product [Paramecium sonneborni]
MDQVLIMLDQIYSTAKFLDESLNVGTIRSKDLLFAYQKLLCTLIIIDQMIIYPVQNSQITVWGQQIININNGNLNFSLNLDTYFNFFLVGFYQCGSSNVNLRFRQ